MALDNPQPETWFASAKLSPVDQLTEQAAKVLSSPVIDALMDIVGGLFAVLNENRQVLAVNQVLLNRLGIVDAEELLGLKPGAVLQCNHAHQLPNGCGTTPHCRTCGAAIAMVSALENGFTAERTCALSIGDQYSSRDLYLSVRAVPREIEGVKVILLFLQDITMRQHWKSIESVFFHDMANLVNGLVFASELMMNGEKTEDLAQQMHRLSVRLGQEFHIQRSLMKTGVGEYQPLPEDIEQSRIIDELKGVYREHPKSRGKTLELPSNQVQVRLVADFALMMRVIHNMVLNAFEATPEGGVVKVSWQEKDGGWSIQVWNAGEIPEAQQNRIFQRNFSTKAAEGRGLGTFSMKYFGEKVLGGRVSFASSKFLGTTFYFWMPLALDGMAN